MNFYFLASKVDSGFFLYGEIERLSPNFTAKEYVIQEYFSTRWHMFSQVKSFGS